MGTPIPYSSRYSQGTLTRLSNSKGVYNLTVLRSVQPSTAPYRLYTWKTSDRPDTVAALVFGDPSLWWAIFDYNPELIYPLNVPSGTVVRIPTNPIVGHGTLVQ
jgi:hypothetical protein